MDDSRPVVMVQEGNNTTLVFKGNEVERDDFLHDFYSLVLEYFKDSEKSFYKPFLYIFKEIVKNIYDHGIGKATLVMIDTQESFSFDFIDENPTLVTFAEISAIDIWKKKVNTILVSVLE